MSLTVLIYVLITNSSPNIVFDSKTNNHNTFSFSVCCTLFLLVHFVGVFNFHQSIYNVLNFSSYFGF